MKLRGLGGLSGIAGLGLGTPPFNDKSGPFGSSAESMPFEASAESETSGFEGCETPSGVGLAVALSAVMSRLFDSPAESKSNPEERESIASMASGEGSGGRDRAGGRLRLARQSSISWIKRAADKSAFVLWMSLECQIPPTHVNEHFVSQKFLRFSSIEALGILGGEVLHHHVPP